MGGCLRSRFDGLVLEVDWKFKGRLRLGGAAHGRVMACEKKGNAMQVVYGDAAGAERRAGSSSLAFYRGTCGDAFPHSDTSATRYQQQAIVIALENRTGP